MNIKIVHQRYELLLETYRDLLAQKNVRTKQRLLEIIKLDLEKLTHALLEVKAQRAQVVLGHFFAKQSQLLPQITAALVEDSIYHLGFEIHEPLDLVLHGMDHWISKTRRTHQCDLAISDLLRFPASPQFQERVAAYTEIMRIWIVVDGQRLMLELFDIHRPVDLFLDAGKPKLTHRNFNCLVTRSGLVAEDRQRATLLFNSDPIWHYAFHIQQIEDVMQLHHDLQAVATEDPNYRLPYDAPVHNPGDGSFHTKIIHQLSGQELEFVAHDSTHAANHR